MYSSLPMSTVCTPSFMTLPVILLEYRRGETEHIRFSSQNFSHSHISTSAKLVLFLLLLEETKQYLSKEFFPLCMAMPHHL